MNILDRIRPTLFFHIPKTAGLTVRHLLDRYFSPHLIEPAADLGEPGTFDPRHDAWQLARGHFDFEGLKRLTNDVGATRVVTFLREPIHHAVSVYLHNVRDSGTGLHELAVGNTLEDFLEDERGRAHLTNFQSHSLLQGFAPDYLTAPPQDQHARAQGLLDEFDVVGIVERFELSVLMLREALGFPPVIFDTHNVNPLRDELSLRTRTPHVSELLAELNQLDTALYRSRLERFQSDTDRLAEALNRSGSLSSRSPTLVFGAGWYSVERTDPGVMFRRGEPGSQLHIHSGEYRGPCELELSFENQPSMLEVGQDGRRVGTVVSQAGEGIQIAIPLTLVSQRMTTVTLNGNLPPLLGAVLNA